MYILPFQILQNKCLFTNWTLKHGNQSCTNMVKADWPSLESFLNIEQVHCSFVIATAFRKHGVCVKLQKMT